jgi:DNA-binding NtrC family response regulator
MALLLDYAWPGNIRELRHAIERAVLLAGDGTSVVPALLPPELQPLPAGQAGPSDPLSPAADRPAVISAVPAAGLGVVDWPRLAELLKEHGSLDAVLALFEWEIVSRAMAAHGGNKSRAAKALGRSYRWLRKLESRLHPSV